MDVYSIHRQELIQWGDNLILLRVQNIYLFLKDLLCCARLFFPLPAGDPIVRKTSMGAFASTGLDHLLRSLEREHLFVTGVSTNMCVETTAREAADRGYAVTLVEDACAATHQDLHEGTLRNFSRFFGKVRSTDEVVDLLG